MTAMTSLNDRPFPEPNPARIKSTIGVEKYDKMTAVKIDADASNSLDFEFISVPNKCNEKKLQPFKADSTLSLFLLTSKQFVQLF